VSVVAREHIKVRIPMAGRAAYEAVIVVESSNGLEGLGEAPLVAGRDPAAAIRGAEETARLDLEARQAGIPLAELLGGVRRRQVECSSLVTDPRADRVAEEVERAYAAGFRCFKLKAANGGGMLDQVRLGAARWAAGPQARLRLDFNGGLAGAEAAVRLPSLAPFQLELLEQPLPPGAAVAEWTELAGRVHAPLAADESLALLGPELKRAGIGLAIKLATVGGPRAALELARGASGPVTIGSSYETSIGLAAALHVACALEREPLACGLATIRMLDQDLAVGLPGGGPVLLLPEAPGLGVELDRSALARYRLDS
jgi:L-alanine-DL-glutamate epimerase-like enolase superfamily enzyme